MSLAAEIGFAARKLAEALLRPSTLMLLGSLAGLALVLLGRGRAGCVLLLISLGTEAALAVVPFDGWLLAPLEDRFAPMPHPPPPATGILVLGGAVDPAITAARGLPSLNGAAERMTEFASLARMAAPGTILAFSGGSGRVLSGGLTEADVARRLFEALGLGGLPIRYEAKSRTTWQNARELARLLHPHAGQRWILVTSAQHMPRAVAAFRDAGFAVIPDPVAYKTAPTRAVAFGTDWAMRLVRLDDAAHEWEGLIAWRLLGRTRHLLPRPEPLD